MLMINNTDDSPTRFPLLWTDTPVDIDFSDSTDDFYNNGTMPRGLSVGTAGDLVVTDAYDNTVTIYSEEWAVMPYMRIQVKAIFAQGSDAQYVRAYF